jgi:hypothetical protein
MNPIVVQILMDNPELVLVGDLPSTESAIVFADDEYQALDTFLTDFLEQYNLSGPLDYEGKQGKAIAYGYWYTAEAFDSVLQPRLFVELMKEMQLTIDAPFEDSFTSWSLKHPHESSQLLAVLDKEVGDLVVNKVAALKAMRPLVIAWRERALICELTHTGHRHSSSKSL